MPKAKLLLPQPNLALEILVDLKALDSTKFHSLCNALVKAEYPESICLEGSGGDEGIDCFLGTEIDGDNLHVFQHKFLPNTLTSGKAQIKKSLEQVLSRHPNVSWWTLVIAKDFTPDEIRWFNHLRKGYPRIKLDIWDHTKLNDLLRVFYTISYDYFPPPEHIDKKITSHLDDLKQKVVRALLNHLKRVSMENLMPIINSELCKDPMANHYSSLDTNLQNLVGHSLDIEMQSCEFIGQIKSLLKCHLVEEGIKYRDDESGTYDMINSIPINQFTERLWPLVESGTYSDNKFWLDEGCKIL